MTTQVTRQMTIKILHGIWSCPLDTNGSQLTDGTWQDNVDAYGRHPGYVGRTPVGLQ